MIQTLVVGNQVGVFVQLKKGRVIFLKKEPLTSVVRINTDNPLTLTEHCIQYVLLDSHMIVGSLFHVRSDYVCSRRKLVVGKVNTYYKPLYGVETSGTLAYRGEQGGLLVVPTELPDNLFLIKDA